MTRTIDVHATAALPQAREITSRIRRVMGDRRISRLALSAATGVSRTSMARKLDDEVQFTIDELAAVCAVLQVNWVWLTVGEGPENAPTPDGEPPRGIEPLTSSLLAQDAMGVSERHIRILRQVA